MKTQTVFRVVAAVNAIERGLDERAAKWAKVQAQNWVEAIVPSGWERRADWNEAEWIYTTQLELDQIRRDLDRETNMQQRYLAGMVWWKR